MHLAYNLPPGCNSREAAECSSVLFVDLLGSPGIVSTCPLLLMISVSPQERPTAYLAIASDVTPGVPFSLLLTGNIMVQT